MCFFNSASSEVNSPPWFPNHFRMGLNWRRLPIRWIVLEIQPREKENPFLWAVQSFVAGPIRSKMVKVQHCIFRLVFLWLWHHICICPYTSIWWSPCWGQKCIAVIERKVLLIVLLFANASDYSNKTCIYRFMCLYLTKYASLVGVVTCVGEERYD